LMEESAAPLVLLYFLMIILGGKGTKLTHLCSVT
jgi:hypothetical protein